MFIHVTATCSLLGRAASIAVAREAPQVDSNEYCHTCRKIDNLCYNHSILLELDAPFGQHPVVQKLGLLQSSSPTTNILYYVFEPVFSDPEYAKVAYISLDAPRFSGIIKGWGTSNFGSFDVNQRDKKIYLGGSDGIWVINSSNFNPNAFTARGDIITNIVSKDYVYFTKLDQPGIFRYKNEKYDDVLLKDEMVNNFVLDRVVDYNIFYLNDTGLYVHFNSKTQTTPVNLSKERFFRGLTVDQKGAVYAWHVDGIYKVTLGKVLSETTLKRVSIIAPDAMTFDRFNNIIYSMGKKLYKLTKVNTSNCV